MYLKLAMNLHLLETILEFTFAENYPKLLPDLYQNEMPGSAFTPKSVLVTCTVTSK
jgi:hypothetical protein